VRGIAGGGPGYVNQIQCEWKICRAITKLLSRYYYIMPTVCQKICHLLRRCLLLRTPASNSQNSDSCRLLSSETVQVLVSLHCLPVIDAQLMATNCAWWFLLDLMW